MPGQEECESIRIICLIMMNECCLSRLIICLNSRLSRQRLSFNEQLPLSLKANRYTFPTHLFFRFCFLFKHSRLLGDVISCWAGGWGCSPPSCLQRNRMGVKCTCNHYKAIVFPCTTRLMNLIIILWSRLAHSPPPLYTPPLPPRCPHQPLLLSYC